VLRALEGGEAARVSGGGQRGREMGRRREVEGGPDRWAPPVSGAREWERGSGLAVLNGPVAGPRGLKGGLGC
jgi:hypothetical protein